MGTNVIVVNRLTLFTLSAPTPHNGQTNSNNLSATAGKLFECIWPFFGVGAERVNEWSLTQKHYPLSWKYFPELQMFNWS